MLCNAMGWWLTGPEQIGITKMYGPALRGGGVSDFQKKILHNTLMVLNLLASIFRHDSFRHEFVRNS